MIDVECIVSVMCKEGEVSFYVHRQFPGVLPIGTNIEFDIGKFSVEVEIKTYTLWQDNSLSAYLSPFEVDDIDVSVDELCAIVEPLGWKWRG